MFLRRDKITNILSGKKQTELYRRVLSSVDGRMVLTDILIDLCFFDEIEDNEKVSFEERAYLRNAATKILRKCGIINSANVGQITEALFKMPRKDV